MDDEDIIQETKEKLEEVTEHTGSWNKYLAITTAIIAVFAAIASLLSGSYSNEAVLRKNDAILMQSKASGQWNYYQAKGIKKNLADAFYQQTNDPKLKADVDKYTKEQNDIQKQAQSFEKQAASANNESSRLLEKHHNEALSVTFFQIAIALSAMSALLRRKSFWYSSILLALVGIGFFLMGLA